MEDNAMPELIIRDAGAMEIPLLVALTIGVWDQTSVTKNITDRFGPINGHPWTDHKADQVLKEIEAADRVVVADAGGEVLAYATLHYDRKYLTGRIGHLGVAAQAQGKGIGRRMVRECLALMRVVGMKYARIEALEQNPRAVNLYASEGFEDVARQIYFFRPL